MLPVKLLVLLSSVSLSRQLSSNVIDRSSRFLAPRGGRAYSDPIWWDTIVATYEGNDLDQCRELGSAPKNGSSCSYKKSGTCFWGNQDCGGEPYPSEKCTCISKKWVCSSDVACPVTTTSSQTRGSCPLVLENHALCPNENPLFKTALCSSSELLYQTCYYGEESCCGECYASFFCSCFAVGESFVCGYTDACYAPSCQLEPIVAVVAPNWETLVGIPCDPDAINIILADNSLNLTEVVCVEDGSIVTSDYRTDRVRIYYDPATGLVSEIPMIG